jgi:hypothetical protein
MSMSWRSLLSAYTDLLKRRPIATNAAQGAFLCAGGDAAAQAIERRPGEGGASTSDAPFESRRCASAAVVGTAFSALIYPNVYRLLDARWPEATLRAVVSKSLAEVATLGTFGNAGSIGSRVLLEGAGCAAARDQVTREMFFVLRNELRIWLPWNVFMFAFVPPFLRPGSTMFVEAGWTTYLSVVAHRQTEPTVEGVYR